jgi:hypothetical protein
MTDKTEPPSIEQIRSAHIAASAVSDERDWFAECGTHAHVFKT